MIVATAGGIAGIVGQTRQEKVNNIVPGVAIATALMPPLCTCGYSIVNGKWMMLAGAAYLFVINTYFIYMSSCFILALLKIPLVKKMTEEEWKAVRKKMGRNQAISSNPGRSSGKGLSRHRRGTGGKTA